MAQAPLYGLVLAGGRSSRMGMDKAQICYHDLPQWKYTLDLLTPLVGRSFLSIRPDQKTQYAGKAELLTDQFPNCGPMGGLLTAQQAFPQISWLIFGCDLPLLTLNSLKLLVEGRKPHLQGGCLSNGTYEPMVSIWEPSTHTFLLHAHKQGAFSLRRIMQQLDFAKTPPQDPKELANINSPQDRQALDLGH